MNPEHIISLLISLHFEHCFNPYVDSCPVHDGKDAPLKRRGILLDLLRAATAKSNLSLWIGRDLGYRGGRRTGMALTDDLNFEAHGRRWDLNLVRPTHGSPCAERTATVIWELLSKIDSPVFLWNVFPLHPYVGGSPFSNRSHNAAERQAGEKILSELIQLLRPARIVAIGNDAAASAQRVVSDISIVHVRHPSYGGQTEFSNSIRSLYGIDDIPLQSNLF